MIKLKKNMSNKILIIEDEPTLRKTMAEYLAAEKFEAIEAADGEQAVAAFKAEHPDAVLLDITMPVMDGLDALRAILLEDPSAKVAMVTAMGQQGVIMEAIKAGAKDFVVKPFDSERIQAALWKLVG